MRFGKIECVDNLSIVILSFKKTITTLNTCEIKYQLDTMLLNEKYITYKIRRTDYVFWLKKCSKIKN